MPKQSVDGMRKRIPYTVLESQLLQAPHRPEALYQVVGWVWSSLVYAAPTDDVDLAVEIGTDHSPSPDVAREQDGRDGGRAKLAPTALAASTGPQWEARALSLQPSCGASGASPLLGTLTSSGALSAHGEPATPYLEHTLAAQATSSRAAMFSDGEEMGNPSTATNLDGTLTAAAMQGHSFITTITAPSSVGESPLFATAQLTPIAQLSSLVLRLLLWWASQPVLPALRSDTLHADNASLHESEALLKGSTNGSDDSVSNFVPTQQRRQQEAEEPHRLRLRIAEIFAMLCNGGFGVVVSDALLYGKCHDASEAAAARCNFTFGSCPAAAWHAATADALLPKTTPERKGRGGAVAGSALPAGSCHASTGEANIAMDGGCVYTTAPPYNISRLLRSLLFVHTFRQLRANTSAASDADVAASGQLLRALLRCPRLHSRLVRLFNSDEKLKVQQPVFGNVPSITLLHSSSMLPSYLGASRQTLSTQASMGDDGTEEPHTISVRLQLFLPALTHPSPVISSDVWKTLEALLFPSACMSTATRKLLLRTPECPVQHLLASALALPDECKDSFNRAHKTHFHPMARNSALRLLHILCVSKDVPPSSQVLFTQCPALLWRVLKLAAELCKGIPVASAALVRRVLADYVMSAVRPTTAGNVPATFTPIQLLLRDNREALAGFFASTYALGGMRGGAADNFSGNSGGYAEAAIDVVFDEEDLHRALQMLKGVSTD